MNMIARFFGTSLLLMSTTTYAGGAKDCKPGEEYDVFTMNCVAIKKPSPSTDSSAVKSDPATTIVRAWRSAVESNTQTLGAMDVEACSFRGGAHKEPALDKVKVIGVHFSDGESQSVIPHELNCRKENDKFALSRTECRLGYYEFKSKLKRFTYEERKIVMDAGDAKGVTWSKMSGDGEYQAAAFMPRSIDTVTNAITTPFSVDANGPGCQLASAVDKLGPHFRGTGARSDAGAGASH